MAMKNYKFSLIQYNGVLEKSIVISLKIFTMR